MAPVDGTVSTTSSSGEFQTEVIISSEKLFPDTGDMVNSIAFVILISFTLFGNLLVIASVIKSTTLRNRTHFFTASLSLANLLFMAGIVMPLRVMSFVDKASWITKPELCKTYSSFFVFFCTVTVYTLAATNLDRFFSISRYKWYPKLLTDCRTVGLVMFCWILAALVSFVSANFGEDNSISVDCKLNRTYTTVYVYVFVSMEVLTPLIFMLILQCRVMKTAVGHIHTVDVRGRQLKNLDYADFAPITKESDWSRLVVRITFSFIIFWIPRCIFLLLDNSDTEGVHEVADGLTEVMTYCYAASFALLLAYFSREYKQVFMDILCPYSCYQRKKDMKKYNLRDSNKVKPSMMYRKHSKNFAAG